MCFFTFFQFYLLEIPNCCKIMCLIKNLSHISNKKSGKRSRPSIRLYTPKKNHTPPSKKIEIDVWDQAKTSSPPLRNFQPANFSPPLKKNISRRMSPSVLLLKGTFFSFFQLWRLAILKPIGVHRHNVPHFKGLILLNLDFEAQGRGSTFTLCHAHLKKAISLGKLQKVQFFCKGL